MLQYGQNDVACGTACVERAQHSRAARVSRTQRSGVIFRLVLFASDPACCSGHLRSSRGMCVNCVVCRPPLRLASVDAHMTNAPSRSQSHATPTRFEQPRSIEESCVVCAADLSFLLAGSQGREHR